MIEIVETPVFTKAIKKILSGTEKEKLYQSLVENPEQGKIIPDTGGARKMRFAYGSKGKSGGLRVIYYYVSARGEIILMTAYPKNQQTNLTEAQKQTLFNLIQTLKGE